MQQVLLITLATFLLWILAFSVIGIFGISKPIAIIGVGFFFGQIQMLFILKGL